MDTKDLNLDADGLAVVDLALTPTMLLVRVASTAAGAACPLCGRVSDRVHSRYERTVADLPAHDRPVGLRLNVRRFRCTKGDCPRSIFCERLPGLVTPHARATGRLTNAHRLVGLALGGEPGSRLAGHLDIPTSPDTLLRRVKSAGGDPPPPPRYIGIDDWAWRKGRRYGTIVVDLERGRVIDLLPDRDAETMKAWLLAHPGVEIISRDRWSEYARAAAEAAPGARQVVDRWHLLKNLREAMERLFERQSDLVARALKAAGAAPETEASSATAHAVEEHPAPVTPAAPLRESVEVSPREQARRAKRRHRVERFEQVHELQKQGRSVRGIARDLKMSRNAVRRYLRRETCPASETRRGRGSKLDAFRPEIDRRISEGCANAATFHRELAARGCPASYHAVRRYVIKRLAAAGVPRSRANAAEAPVSAPPSAKRLSFDWVRRVEARNEPQEARLRALRDQCAELASALGLADEFAALIRKQPSGTLAGWLARAESCECPEIRRFAEGIRRDEAAIDSAMTESWSNGPVEGHVNRLKAIKRQMFGRAGFALLRARVIHAA
jgi:transposase